MKDLLTKLMAVALAAAMMLTMAACAGKQKQEQETAPNETIAVPPNPQDCTEMGTPLADLRVRQALACAIDMDTVIEALLYGSAEKADGFSSAGQYGESDAAGLEYDPERAKELLAEAGWPSDYVLDVVYYYDDPLTLDVLHVIGSYWEAVGVKSSFRKLEGDVAAQLWTAPENPTEDDAAVSWDLAYGAVAPLTEADYYSRFASTASNNSHTPPQESLDELIAKARSADTEAKRQEYHGQIRQILSEHTLVIPLYHQDCYLYTSDHLDMAGTGAGNDQFAYEKNILNWTTDREDGTLYTNGGPVEFYCDPVVNPGLYLYQELLFERLLCADGNLSVTGIQLAESYDVRDSGRTVEFVLPEDITWHDGEPLTAEDVKFTFELYLKCPGASSVLTGVLNNLEGAEAFCSGEAETCSGITVDENKVTFVFSETALDALAVFSQWPILPKHCLEEADPEALQQDAFWKDPIGSGPYRVEETVMGESCILQRWEDYRLTGEGNVERIFMAASGEMDGNLVLRADLEKLDYAWGKSPEDAAAIRQMEGMTATPVQIPYLRCFYINQFPHESYHSSAEQTE